MIFVEYGIVKVRCHNSCFTLPNLLLFTWKKVGFMKYMISYDLIKSKNYDAIINAIKDISEIHSRPCKSTWVIKSSKTTEEIFEYIQNHIDNDDLLVVVEFKGQIFKQVEPEIDAELTKHFGKYSWYQE